MEWGSKETSEGRPTSNSLFDVRPPQPAKTESTILAWRIWHLRRRIGTNLTGVTQRDLNLRRVIREPRRGNGDKLTTRWRETIR
ncbi:hypothetical protein EVAR_45308_1 [Eumeta japonica]|uniref:Uncharacterized protein n=1 Tax=Eumeta variegata TaxID=151549 RepID=A0A4C1XMB3_EUMVA|nr:hypothetical protein EVAR_45308_1 [Eumeta japonica]